VSNDLVDEIRALRADIRDLTRVIRDGREKIKRVSHPPLEEIFKSINRAASVRQARKAAK
jgi:hypothetical protein